METSVRRTELYRGRKAVLATMHGKERAIEAPMRALLGLEIEVCDLDTDALGTFTGEIARPGTMRETAISKARLGMRRTGCPVGLASEGSYGPHPFVPFLPTGTELLVLVDDANGYVIQESLVCEKTNFDHVTATDIGMIEAFLDRVRFPGHAMIVQPNQPVEERGARLAVYARRLTQAAPFRRSIAAGPAKSIIYKGVQCEDALKAAFDECARLSQDGQVLVTTDMRASANPTRMNSIRLLADRLAERVACPCPACGAPGYGRIPILWRLKSWAASRANAARRGRGPMVPHRRRQRTVPGAILRTEPPKGRSEQTAWRFLLRERRKKGAPWGAFIVEVLREAAISCRGSCGASASGSGA